jgi:hypothetical protein
MNVEKITQYINLRTLCIACTVSLIVLLLCIGCYTYGQRAAERDIELQRVQSAERNVQSAATEVTNAEATNRDARETVTESRLINGNIGHNVDRSIESVKRSKAANSDARATVTEAERIARDTKQSITESEQLIASGQRILGGAYQRAQETATQRTSK